MKPATDFTSPKIAVTWQERGNLISALGEIKTVQDKLVESRRNLKSHAQFKTLCMARGALEVFLLATGPDNLNLTDPAKLAQASRSKQKVTALKSVDACL